MQSVFKYLASRAVIIILCSHIHMTLNCPSGFLQIFFKIFKRSWRSSSSGRELALQVQGSEFDPQYSLQKEEYSIGQVIGTFLI